MEKYALLSDNIHAIEEEGKQMLIKKKVHRFVLELVLFGVGLTFLTANSWAENKGEKEKYVRLPAKMTIHTSRDNSSCYQYAVTELARLLGRFNIVTSVSPGSLPQGGSLIQLTCSNALMNSTVEQKGIQADGYILEVTPKGVAIHALEPKGALNAVYAFAERLGYLFLYPGVEGEWLPDLDGKRPGLTTGVFAVNPRFPHRGIFNGNSEKEWAEYYAKLGLNTLCNPIEPELAARVGLRVEVGGHDLAGLFPRENYKTNPDLFRMSQPEDYFGKRVDDFNCCITNSETRQLLQKNYLAKLKPLVQQSVYAWHTWPEDLPANGWCYCTTCRSFSPADQAMMAMSTLAEVVRREKLPVRVPVLAYHDTMFPGIKIDAPKECFLLFAPRERCYGHALDDPACPKNRAFMEALKAWESKFSKTDDAHTFEYYLDRVLYRGLYPFLPDIILQDMKVYKAHGIQTHLALMVGTAFVPRQTMLNLPLFAKGNWDESLDASTFIEETAQRILPRNPEPWRTYLTKRAEVFREIMQWEHETEGWCDYRWLPETTLPFGTQMVPVYEKGSHALAEIADALEKSITPDWPKRVREYAESEIVKTRFEAAEVATMAAQQDAANHDGRYLNTGLETEKQQAVQRIQDTLSLFEVALKKAHEADIKQGDYYYMFNEVIQKELSKKRAALMK